MATQPKTGPIGASVRLADKEALIQMMDELNEQLGVVPDAEATIERLRARLLAEGVRPEQNKLTHELLRMRYGEE
jgi:hypothetical protein